MHPGRCTNMGSCGDLRKMRLHTFLTLCIVLGIIASLSGCTNTFFSQPTTYVTHPVQIQYALRYGYYVNLTGNERYEVQYTSDLPEVLIGTSPYTILNTTGMTQGERANNTVVTWNLTGKNPQRYVLGLRTEVNAQTYLFPDLMGKDAMSLAQLHTTAEDYVHRYTRVQGNETIRYIDPADPQIKAIADSVLNTSSTNAFLLAKALFTWLKENVHYQTHAAEGVQPAALTLSLKAGDCDDLSFLYISLCRAVGVPARFIRGYLITDTPSVQAVAHAWVEVFIGTGVGIGGWIPVETSCITNSVQTDIEQNFGIEDCFHLRVFQDMGNNDSLSAALSGIVFTENVEPPVSFAIVQDYQVVSSKQLVVNTDGTRSLQSA